MFLILIRSTSSVYIGTNTAEIMNEQTTQNKTSIIPVRCNRTYYDKQIYQ